MATYMIKIVLKRECLFIIKRFYCLLALLGAVFCVWSEEEIVFDNVDVGYKFFCAPLNIGDEMGDEIALGGIARKLERIEIECYGEMKEVTSSKYAIIRLYRQDGQITPDYVLPPKTLFYESQPLPVKNGIFVLEADLGGVVAGSQGEHFTWMVQFLGQEQGDKLGIMMFPNPGVGYSYDDYWTRACVEGSKGSELGEEFKVRNFGESVKGNFGVRIYASDAPELRFAGLRLDGEAAEIEVVGPVYTPVRISASQSALGESYLSRDLILTGGTNSIRLENLAEGINFFRMEEFQDIPPQITVTNYTSRLLDLLFTGIQGSRYEYFFSTNGIDWELEERNYFTGIRVSLRDYHIRTSDLGFYRLEQLNELEMPKQQLLEYLPEQESCAVRFSGPRGAQVLISYSLDGVHWSKPQRERFSYSSVYETDDKSGMIYYLFPHYKDHEDEVVFRFEFEDIAGELSDE